MRYIARAIFLTFIFTCLLVPSPPIAAAAGDSCQRPVDLVLALDDSRSMVDEDQSDPTGLRITAAHLLLDLLDPTDRVGLVFFPPDGVRPSMGTVEQTKAALRDRLNDFHSMGATDLLTAVRTGLDLLSTTESGRTRALLLLTDGVPTTGQKSALIDLAAQQKPENKERTALYIIALGSKTGIGGTEETLLQDMAKEAESEHLWQVVKAADLSQAFLEILQHLKGLNIEAAAQDGTLITSGLSSEVRIAGLLPRGDSPVVSFPSVTASSADTPSVPDRVEYTPFVRHYSLPVGAPQQVTVDGATVSWKVERPPVAIQMQSPAPLANLPTEQDAEIPVQLRLTPCQGAVPTGLRADVEVLNAQRKPTDFRATLTQDPDDPSRVSGTLRLHLAPGDYVLRARIRSAQGQQVALLDQSVKAPSDAQWLVQAPAELVAGEPATITVQHTVAGAPTDVLPPLLTVLLPDGGADSLTLMPAGAPGRFAAPLTTPLSLEGPVRYRIGDHLAESKTMVRPVRLQFTAPARLEVPFAAWWANEPITIAIEGETDLATERLERLPPITAAAPPLTASVGPWEREGTDLKRYRATATLPSLAGESLWARALAVVRQRSVSVTVAPAEGDYYLSEPPAVTISLKLKPLVHWYWLLGGSLLLLLLGRWLKRLLARGPVQQLLITPPNQSTAIPLRRWHRKKGVGWQIRLGSVDLQPDVPLTGMVPPQLQLRITATDIPGHEQFTIHVDSPHQLKMDGQVRQGSAVLDTSKILYDVAIDEYLLRVERRIRK